MVRGKRNEAERALPSFSRQHPTASRRRRRVEGTSEPLDVSKAVDPSLSEPYASPSVAVVADATEASQQEQPSDHDDISVGPLPGGLEDPSILKSFKNHVAFAIWLGEVIWMPYWRARAHHPLPEITFFSGCLKCESIIEPYHPEKVLRQFGYVQTIPPPPLSPIEAKQGAGTASYRVIYEFIDDSWNRWEIHLLPPYRRGRPCEFPWHFTYEYLP
ncbi:uncharacterized protein LOC127796750 [Diospyros lotus]|uniref:uncharacterized protein LOC127796750 n=1 Tax=Diospyros lotus TaxID=55363 RepID=UPI002253283B|nr:uncharacterized protein LOC127796750 [Diospyros lotus]